MTKKLSSDLVIGNALITIKKNHISKEEVYKYWNIVDTLLPEEYYTYVDNTSFEDFCDNYSFLLKSLNDLIIDYDMLKLLRHFRIGLPSEVAKAFDEAGRKLIEIELQCRKEMLLLDEVVEKQNVKTLRKNIN